MIMSREKRKYRKPPITEAVIDIRVRGDQAIPVTSLEQIGHLEKERYPTRLEGVQIVQEFEFEPSKEARKTSHRPRMQPRPGRKKRQSRARNTPSSAYLAFRRPSARLESPS